MGWTTINNKGELQELKGENLKIGVDTISDLEKYTSYNFSIGQKVGGIGVTLEKDTKNAINTVTNNVSNALDFSIYYKYIPVALLVLLLLKRRK
jgi:hypothetical protein